MNFSDSLVCLRTYQYLVPVGIGIGYRLTLQKVESATVRDGLKSRPGIYVPALVAYRIPAVYFVRVRVRV